MKCLVCSLTFHSSTDRALLSLCTWYFSNLEFLLDPLSKCRKYKSIRKQNGPWLKAETTIWMIPLPMM